MYCGYAQSLSPDGGFFAYGTGVNSDGGVFIRSGTAGGSSLPDGGFEVTAMRLSASCADWRDTVVVAACGGQGLPNQYYLEETRVSSSGLDCVWSFIRGHTSETFSRSDLALCCVTAPPDGGTP